MLWNTNLKDGKENFANYSECQPPPLPNPHWIWGLNCGSPLKQNSFWSAGYFTQRRILKMPPHQTLSKSRYASETNLSYIYPDSKKQIRFPENTDLSLDNEERSKSINENKRTSPRSRDWRVSNLRDASIIISNCFPGIKTLAMSFEFCQPHFQSSFYMWICAWVSARTCVCVWACWDPLIPIRK